jgi:hypothetical protein
VSQIIIKGVGPNTEKLNAILEWPEPTNLHKTGAASKYFYLKSLLKFCSNG